MANLPETTRRGADTAAGVYVLTPGTLVSAAVAVCLAQVALAIPAALERWRTPRYDGWLAAATFPGPGIIRRPDGPGGGRPQGGGP